MVYYSMICFLIVGIFSLGSIIYNVKGFEPLIATFTNIIEKTNLNDIKQWLFLENWLKDDSVNVSFEQSYTHLEDNYYSVINSEVISLDDGIVIYSEKQDSGYVVMVKNDNGVIATYGALNEINCSVDDRVLKGMVLGNVIDNVYLEFSYNGQSVSFEDINEDKN